MRFASILGTLLLAIWATPSFAGFLNCPNGCYIPPDPNPYFVDYTVPPDGITYVWTLRLESSDPGTTITITGPGQADHMTYFYGGGSSFSAHDFAYRFDEVVQPLLTTITVWAPRNYNNCALPGPIGEICGETFNVWGNASAMIITPTVGVTLYSTITAVPEPSVWALLIAGFGLAGGAMRSRRKSAAFA